jgi:hypothetical protein
MNETTLERLTEELRGTVGPPLPPEVLARAKRRGARRRRTRTAVAGLVAVTVVGGSVALLAPGVTGSGQDDLRGVAGRPAGLSPLQERVLREVPGAERLSVWQVAVPEPKGAVDTFPSGDGDFEVQGPTFATGVTSYTGVTLYERDTFPAWLYDAVLAQEVDAGDENGQPVGSTDMGIAVENGTLELACVSFQGAECHPAVVRADDDGVHYEWGFGSDRFLEPFSRMEVFGGNDAPEDAPSLAVAGLPDDSVAEADFITTTGEVVAGSVDHTMAPGSSILWAKVPGALARVVAYDAEGDVVEDHALRACSGVVVCEVR